MTLFSLLCIDWFLFYGRRALEGSTDKNFASERAEEVTDCSQEVAVVTTMSLTPLDLSQIRCYSQPTTSRENESVNEVEEAIRRRVEGYKLDIDCLVAWDCDVFCCFSLFR